MDNPRSIIRDAAGRFTPGCSGNPLGKRSGTRNRASLLAEALAAGEAESIARVVIDKALAGDAVAARFCVDRLNPRPRGRAIRLDVPVEVGPGGLAVATFNAALRAMAAGEITPDEAVMVSRALEGRYRVLRAVQMERRLTGARRAIPGDATVADEDDQFVASVNNPPPLAREGRVGKLDAAAELAGVAANPGFPLDPPPQAGEEEESDGDGLVPAGGLPPQRSCGERPAQGRPQQETCAPAPAASPAFLDALRRAPAQPRPGRNILSDTPAFDLQTTLRTATSGVALAAARRHAA